MKWDMNMECEICMSIRHEWMVRICVIVRLSLADSLHWLWNLELNRADSSSSGHMKKNENVRWASWAGRIATQNFMWGYVRLWDWDWAGRIVSVCDHLWEMRIVRWFRPDTKNMMCDINWWIMETEFCFVFNWMSLESWYVVWYEMLVLWIKYVLLCKLNLHTLCIWWKPIYVL